MHWRRDLEAGVLLEADGGWRIGLDLNWIRLDWVRIGMVVGVETEVSQST